MLSLLYLRAKAQVYFVSLSYMFLDKKTLLKIWLNPGLNFRGTEPSCYLVLSFILVVGSEKYNFEH